jgi:hypothetical protein
MTCIASLRKVNGQRQAGQTMNQPPRAAMDAARSLSGADMKVVARPERRQFPDAQKCRIPSAADR